MSALGYSLFCENGHIAFRSEHDILEEEEPLGCPYCGCTNLKLVWEWPDSGYGGADLVPDKPIRYETHTVTMKVPVYDVSALFDDDRNRYEKDIDEAEKLLNSEYRSLVDLIDQIREKCSPEERELLNSIWDAAERFVFLVAWLRSHLDLKNHDHIIETLHNMFEGGEDDFESYYPKLANLYLRWIALERLYARQLPRNSVRSLRE